MSVGTWFRGPGSRGGLTRTRPRLLRPVRALACVALVLAGGVTGVLGAPAAEADGPTTFANATPIAVPAAGSPNQTGTASPYPSGVVVSGMTGSVSTVTVSLKNVTHTVLNDVDVLVVAPTGASLVVLSDAGGSNALAFTSNATLTFDDAAAGGVPSGNVPSGTYRPTNIDDGHPDVFPAPAPAPSGATTLAGAFGGTNPNGTWQLYVVDDATGDIGTLAGGWSLTITTVPAPVGTTTTLTSSENPSTTGSAVTFTATVTAGGSPVTTGTVQFSDGGSTLGAPVALAGSGTASLTTQGLAAGTHALRATYSGAAGFTSSAGTLTQIVEPLVVASPGGPYTVAEGDALTLDGSGSTAPPGTTFAWDLDGDGAFDDATGPAPTLSWSQLEALGLGDGPSSHVVGLRVTDAGQTSTATTTLQVTNVGPRVRLTYNVDIRAGAPATFRLDADEPSSVDVAAGFTYRVDWGDGSPVQEVFGPATVTLTHVFAAPGVVTAFFGATDKDGGTQEANGVDVEISGAVTSTTTSATTTSATTSTTSATTTTASTTPTTTATTPPTTDATTSPASTPAASASSPTSVHPVAVRGTGATGSGVGSTSLATTGASAGPIVLVAGFLVAAGLGLVLTGRRKGGPGSA